MEEPCVITDVVFCFCYVIFELVHYCKWTTWFLINFQDSEHIIYAIVSGIHDSIAASLFEVDETPFKKTKNSVDCLTQFLTLLDGSGAVTCHNLAA